MRGRVHKYGDNVDTDSIIPGRFLKEMDPKRLAEHAMEGIDPNFVMKVKQGDFIVAGKNFGCGSSREHAPIALKYAGIRAVLAKSFARIFYRNAVDGGFLIPIEIDDNIYERLSDGDEIEVDVSEGTIRNITKGEVYKMRPIPELVMKIIRAGGIFMFKQE
ncbi:MAG: 3-isopropylmalate dehydratase small subunit [Candidatus Terraquivivens tikiterensis]|uniref:3-isopropylmalate dehydratase small subunit n=1 Tax=Candidatus Terraquivivens tikiterensis TaxID=1980982 RepID=A0A2R7YAS1_9ARCH|nr:MAG: 3-isopropylmalate dehydratase small subunit [Candidatus Terraquivivens tikiterensis]